MFLETEVAAQISTFALVPQIADAVKVPMIAAGGIADAPVSPQPSRSARRACRSAPPTSAARSASLGVIALR